MADRFIVLDAADRFVGAYRTQAKATSVAAADAAYTARTGAVSVPSGVNTEWTYRGGNWLPPESVLAPLDTLKQAARVVHGQFVNAVYPNLRVVTDSHPAAIGGLVHDIVVGQFRGAYITLNDSTISHALRTSYVSNIILGPTEITDTDPLEQMEQLVDATLAATIPTAWTRGNPISFVQLADDRMSFVRRALQLSLDQAVADFPSVPTFPHILNGRWIDQLS